MKFWKAARFDGDILLTGKTAVITGSNTGIGKETAKDFYKRGARVIIACRNLEKGEQAVQDIIKECEDSEHKGEIVVRQLDLNKLSLVRKCAEGLLETEPNIHLLINNAGVMVPPTRYTEDGFETNFGVNHLGHFLFTLLLLPKIIQSAPARIVTVSSTLHKLCRKIDFDDINFKERPYGDMLAYGQSKLANILFTKELAKKLTENNISNVTVYSLHPGVISTELSRNLGTGLKFVWKAFVSWFTKSPKEGAQTTLHCALDEDAGNETGLYYSECKVTTPANQALDEEAAKKLWEVSLEMAGLEPDFDPFQTENTSSIL